MVDSLHVLILDDQFVQREGIARAVEDAEAMKVVASTGSPEQAMDVLAKVQVHLALIDLVLHKERGTSVGRAMRCFKPDLPVIIYTHEKSMVLAADIFWSRKETGQPALQGYLLTSSINSGSTLRQVYDQIMKVGYYIDPEILRWHYRLAEFDPLTKREEQCALLVAEGFSNEIISRELGISSHRVENIISTLYLKFRILGDPGNPGRRVLLAEAIRLLYGYRPMTERLRVLIVDDQESQRRRLKRILSEDRRLWVIGEADSGQAGLLSVLERKPDIVLMDVHLPDMDGFQVTRQILRQSTGIQVILHTADLSWTYLEEARQAGAAALLSKREITGASVYSLYRQD
jgi:DNA-binding NarL/FixJ family response regulator